MESNKVETKEFNIILNDVRKAYRFIYVFQRRVMDLVKFIGNHYGFSYQGGYSNYSEPFKKGRGKLENSAWEFLPMYHIEFQFTTPHIGGRELVFSILLQCDTGFYDTELDESRKTNLELFKSPEESETFLHLVLREHGSNINDYKRNRLKSTSLELFPDETSNSNQKGILVGYKVLLSELINEKNTKELLKKFEDHCASNSIILRIQE